MVLMGAYEGFLKVLVSEINAIIQDAHRHAFARDALLPHRNHIQIVSGL